MLGVFPCGPPGSTALTQPSRSARRSRRSLSAPQRRGCRPKSSSPPLRRWAAAPPSALDEERPGGLQEVVEAAGLEIEIARLRVELRRQLEEVGASRTRIVSAG